jgi:hypothetical protein
LPFFFVLSNSFFTDFSGGGTIIFSPGFCGFSGLETFLISGLVILCLTKTIG